jgi:hypothetical protein
MITQLVLHYEKITLYFFFNMIVVFTISLFVI